MSFLIPPLASLILGVAIFVALKPAGVFWTRFSRKRLGFLLKQFEDVSYELPGLDARLRLWGGVMAASIFAGFFLLKPILGFIVAFIIFIIPEQILRRMLRKRISILKKQLISGVVMIANTLKSGVSIEKAFEAAAREVPAPLGLEFQRISYECSHGRVFEQVLLDAKDRIKLQEFVVFIAALITNKKRGGDVARTLEEIKNSLVENGRLERKLEADTASGRMVINVLAAVPVLFLIVSQAMNPEGTQLMFSTLAGQGILAIAAVMTYAGYRWGQKIVDIKF